MIHKDMKISFADIKKIRMFLDTVEFIYNQNIFNLVKGENTEIFESETVKIAESRGWTELRSIDCKECDVWYQINTKHDKMIKCSGDQLIPVYDITKKKIGFHGETMYHHEFKEAKDISPNDLLRVRGCYDEQGDAIFFDEVKDIEVIHLLDKGYEFTTRYGYCNCNGIYIKTNKIEN